jgi:hypothetical protein
MTDHNSPRCRLFVNGTLINDVGWRARFTTSWDVEVLDDGANWVKIDERKNIQQVNGSDRTLSAAVRQSPICQYIRIRGTHQVSHPLELKCIEIFGTLIEP